MTDEKNLQICQYCKNKKDKKCKVTDEYVSRKKSCDINQFTKKGG
jgi:hypothetical protein